MRDFMDFILKCSDVLQDFKAAAIYILTTLALPSAAVITLPALDGLVVLGVTIAAWFKILSIISVLLIIFLNLIKIIRLFNVKINNIRHNKKMEH